MESIPIKYIIHGIIALVLYLSRISSVGMWKATDRNLLVDFQHNYIKARNLNKTLGFLSSSYNTNLTCNIRRLIKRPNLINVTSTYRKPIKLNLIKSDSPQDSAKHSGTKLSDYTQKDSSYVGTSSSPHSQDKNDSSVEYKNDSTFVPDFNYDLLIKRVEKILIDNLNDKDVKNQLCALNSINLFARSTNFLNSSLKSGLLSNLLNVLEKPYQKNIWKLVNTYIWPNKPLQTSEILSVQEFVLKILISLSQISDKVSREMAKNEDLKGLLLKIYCVYNQLNPQQDTIEIPERDKMKSLIEELFLELGYTIDPNITLVSPNSKDSDSKDESWTWEKILPFSSSEENGPIVSVKDYLIPIKNHTHKVKSIEGSKLVWIPYYYSSIDSKESIMRNLKIYLGKFDKVMGISDLEKLTLKPIKLSSKNSQLLGLLAVNFKLNSANIIKGSESSSSKDSYSITEDLSEPADDLTDNSSNDTLNDSVGLTDNTESVVELLCNVNMESSDHLNLSLLTNKLLSLMGTCSDFLILNDIFTELWSLLGLRSPEVLNVLHSKLDLDLVSDIINYSCFDFDSDNFVRDNYLKNYLANNLKINIAMNERMCNIFDRLTRLKDLVKDHFENSPKGSITNILYNFARANSTDSNKLSIDLDELNSRMDSYKSDRMDKFMNNKVESAKILQMTLFGFLVELIYVDGNRSFIKIRDHERLIESVKKAQASLPKPVSREEIEESDVDKYRPLIDKRLELKTVATNVFNQENLNADFSMFDKYRRLTLNGIDFLDIRLNSWKNQKLCLKNDIGAIYNSNKLLNILGHHDQNKIGNRGVRILSIDGGGSKGVIALEILDHLHKHLNKPLHECFDLICGTSTGGLLASLIALEKMPVSEIKHLYDSMIKSIFVRDGYHVTGTRLLMKQAIYDDNIFKDILKTSLEEIELIDYSVDTACPKFFCVSTQMDVTPLRPILWRNYNYHKDVYSLNSNQHYSADEISKLIQLNGGSCTIRLRDAIKATTAALGYFPLFERNGHMYGDGAFYCNNPSVVALLEAKLLYPNNPVDMLVSIGNGVSKLANVPSNSKAANGDTNAEVDQHLAEQDEYINSLVKLYENCMDHGNQNGSGAKKENKLLSLDQVFTHITYAATTSEMTHSALEFTMPKNVYFRFSPVVPVVKIDETDPITLNTLKTQTKQYLSQEDIQERLDAIRQLIERDNQA